MQREGTGHTLPRPVEGKEGACPVPARPVHRSGKEVLLRDEQRLIREVLSGAHR